MTQIQYNYMFLICFCKVGKAYGELCLAISYYFKVIEENSIAVRIQVLSCEGGIFVLHLLLLNH